MCYHNTTKHYKIDKRKTATGEVFAIEEGPTFENLMDVSNKTSSKSFGKSASLPLTAENGLALFMCY